MKLPKSSLAAIATFAIFNVANAGPSSGGGGMGVQCVYDQSRVITTTVELLDTYEARLKDTLQLMRPTGDVEEDYFRLVRNTYGLQGYPSLAEELKSDILRNFRNFFGIVDWTDEELPFLGDQGRSADLPVECSLKQLAIFHDSRERVEINRPLFNKLNSLDQAALVVHELFYKYERFFRESTSESTRSYVGQVLAISGVTPVKEGIELAKKECSAASEEKVLGSNMLSTFSVHESRGDNGKTNTVLQFTHIAGRPLLVKTTVAIPDFKLDVQPKFLSTEPYMVAIPANPGQDLTVKLPVETDHRGDWELLIKYQYPEPISLTLIQDGSPIATALLSSCN